jgi:hypothetical protein
MAKAHFASAFVLVIRMVMLPPGANSRGPQREKIY